MVIILYSILINELNVMFLFRCFFFNYKNVSLVLLVMNEISVGMNERKQSLSWHGCSFILRCGEGKMHHYLYLVHICSLLCVVMNAKLTDHFVFYCTVVDYGLSRDEWKSHVSLSCR